MFLRKNKKISCSFFFIVFVLVLSGFLSQPKETLAWWGFGDLVFDEMNYNVNLEIAAANTATAEATAGLQVKETILDGILWAIANAVIEKIADSTVDWINGGFNGGPSFVTDLGGFLTDVGDQTVGEFIAGSPLAFLCSPFGLDIKIALSLQFGGKREAYCTLTEVFENADNAIDDLGNDWSWSKFNNIAQTQNNAYGAYLSAYTELTLKMAEEKDKTIQKSNWGGGFLSFDVCEDDEEVTECDDVMEEGRCETYMVPGKCETKTPGKTIGDSLTKVLGLGNDKLVVADEIDEIIGALLNQLISAVFNSAGGLFSSNPGGDDDGNFSKLPASTVEEMRNLISTALGREVSYEGWKQKSLDIVLTAENYLLALIECWETDQSDTFTSQEIQDKIDSAQQIIDNIITPLKTTLEADISVADTNIEKLNDLIIEIDTATDGNGEADPVVINDIWKEFDDLELHTDTDVASAESEYQGTVPEAERGIKYDMDAIISRVLSEKTTCEDGGGIFSDPDPTYVPGDTTPEPESDNPPVDPALEAEAGTYTSINQYIGKNGGVTYPKGFQDRYNPYLYGYNTSDLIKFDHAVESEESDFVTFFQEDKIRVFIPPYVTRVGVSLAVTGGASAIAWAARWKQPVSKDYSSNYPENYLQATNADQDRITLKELENKDVVFRKSSEGWVGIIRTYDPPQEGGWLYLDHVYSSKECTDTGGGVRSCLSAGTAVVKLVFEVDKGAYINWYNNAEWDANGDPLPLIGLAI